MTGLPQEQSALPLLTLARVVCIRDQMSAAAGILIHIWMCMAPFDEIEIPYGGQAGAKYGSPALHSD